LLAGQVSSKYSPVEVAQWLEDLARTAAESLAQASAQTMDLREPFFRRSRLIQTCKLTRPVLSEKLRAAVLYALYDRTSERAARKPPLRPTGQPGTPGTHRRSDAKAYVPDLTYAASGSSGATGRIALAAIDHDIAAMEQKLHRPVRRPLRARQTRCTRRRGARPSAATERPHRPHASGIISPGQLVALA